VFPGKSTSFEKKKKKKKKRRKGIRPAVKQRPRESKRGENAKSNKKGATREVPTSAGETRWGNKKTISINRTIQRYTKERKYPTKGVLNAKEPKVMGGGVRGHLLKGKRDMVILTIEKKEEWDLSKRRVNPYPNKKRGNGERSVE